MTLTSGVRTLITLVALFLSGTSGVLANGNTTIYCLCNGVRKATAHTHIPDLPATFYLPIEDCVYKCLDTTTCNSFTWVEEAHTCQLLHARSDWDDKTMDNIDYQMVYDGKCVDNKLAALVGGGEGKCKEYSAA